MTKKKIIKLFAILAAVFLGSLEMGWRFFNMVVCCKRGEQKKERKKWFELSHIRENHPQNGYAREYNESKAWCFEQNMQDCYIKSTSIAAAVTARGNILLLEQRNNGMCSNGPYIWLNETKRSFRFTCTDSPWVQHLC